MLTHEEVDDVHVVTLVPTKILYAEDVTLLVASLTDAICRTQKKKIVLSLSRVEHTTSEVSKALLIFSMKNRGNVQIVLCGLKPYVKEGFTVTKAIDHFRVYETQDLAVTALADTLAN